MNRIDSRDTPAQAQARANMAEAEDAREAKAFAHARGHRSEAERAACPICRAPARANKPAALEAIRAAYTTATGAWTGCDWTEVRYYCPVTTAEYEHGDCGGDCEDIDLDGVTAEEARRRAKDLERNARERAEWESAADWLEDVEGTAASAEEHGAAALEAAEAGDLERAEREAQAAVSAEDEYGDAPTWRPLLTAIEAAISEAEEAGDPCACGCGERTMRTVERLREQDRGTAETLGWVEMSVGPMRVPIACVEGHEDDLVGYVDEE